MSTSLLYHGFGIRGYEYVKTEYEGGRVVSTIRQEWNTLRCRVCGSRAVIRRGTSRRRLRSVHIGSKPVQVVMDVPQVRARTL